MNAAEEALLSLEVRGLTAEADALRAELAAQAGRIDEQGTQVAILKAAIDEHNEKRCGCYHVDGGRTIFGEES